MNITHRCILFSVVAAAASAALAAGPQYTLTTLASFYGTNGSGHNPIAGLIADPTGNLYGTTYQGGANGDGTVFKVANDANHTLSTLASFNSTNGANTTGYGPAADLIADTAGNLYGTTVYGGASSNYGTVFKVANDANHTLSVLTSFNSRNGGNPGAGLIADTAGNLYGTTYSGGNLTLNNGTGYGTVFKVANDANHTLTTLISFNNTNGANPSAGLIADAAGNLYDTTVYGGNLTFNDGMGYGTVFKVANDANHTLSTLASFNSTTGYLPYAGLIADPAGNLYGTTFGGGTSGVGTVFKVANNANHTLSTLVSFNTTNGANPAAGLIADAAGNLYGTTEYGGVYSDGTVFEVANNANHTLSTLVSFNRATGFNTTGYGPAADLIADTAGNLYGTTEYGGVGGYGTVFELLVPEPSTSALLAIGCGLLIASRHFASAHFRRFKFHVSAGMLDMALVRLCRWSALTKPSVPGNLRKATVGDMWFHPLRGWQIR